MGRLVGILADIVALARVLVEARSAWRDWRGDGPEARSSGRGDRERPDQQKPDRAGSPGSEERP